MVDYRTSRKINLSPVYIGGETPWRAGERQERGMWETAVISFTDMQIHVFCQVSVTLYVLPMPMFTSRVELCVQVDHEFAFLGKQRTNVILRIHRIQLPIMHFLAFWMVVRWLRGTNNVFSFMYWTRLNNNHRYQFLYVSVEIWNKQERLVGRKICFYTTLCYIQCYKVLYFAILMKIAGWWTT